MKKRKNAGNEGIKRALAGELRKVGWSFWGCRDLSDGEGSNGVPRCLLQTCYGKLSSVGVRGGQAAQWVGEFSRP